jgi:hypothetical protein
MIQSIIDLLSLSEMGLPGPYLNAPQPKDLTLAIKRDIGSPTREVIGYRQPQSKSLGHL